MALAAT